MNTVIGEGYAMGVTAQIIENLPRSSKWRFGINHPFALLHRFEVVEEGSLLLQRFDFTDELNLVSVECFFQGLEKQTAEQARQDPHRQKEAGAARNPFAIGTGPRGYPAAGDNEMDMGMVQQILSPGVEYAEKADLRAQVLGIARDGEEGFGGGMKENAVDDFPIVKGDAGDRVGEGKDDVEIFDRQQFFLPAVKPLGPLRVQALGAVAVTAGVVRNARVVALVALFDMTSEGGGAARFNRPHHAQLIARQPALSAVIGAVLSKNAGQLMGRPGQCLYRRPVGWRT